MHQSSARIIIIIIMALMASPIYTSSIVTSSTFVLEDIRSSVVESSGEALLSATANQQQTIKKPFVDGAFSFHGGEIKPYRGDVLEIVSPIIELTTGDGGDRNKHAVIGRLAQMNHVDIEEVLSSAKKAWNHGFGEWPQMSANDRIDRLERVVVGLQARREEIITVLMWEICKSAVDAAAEFDRTMLFIEATIAAYRKLDREEGGWNTISGIFARVRRAAIGIMLCLGPFNYPFNETYATLIPALLAGNVVIMKVPNLGGLAHLLTMEVYRDCLPAGAMNFFSGSGRETMGPLMSTGDIDVLAFIGGSQAADSIIKAHPNPHRLKVFLQLEGKNLGIVLPDAHIETAVQQIVLGSTTYNGQRCTAIKLVMVHESVVDQFLEQFIPAIDGLKWGLPWEAGVAITPLPEPKKPQYLRDLIVDAKAHGAKVVNEHLGGSKMHGALMRPAIVYPVTSAMRLWREEQFGPVIPIAVYKDPSDLISYLSNTTFGQQAAVFTSNSEAAAPLLDLLSTSVGRINLNTQCGRSPDSLPFSGRKSSALGTMSVTEALKFFSTETVVAAKAGAINEKLLRDMEAHSHFLQPLNESTPAMV